MYPLADFGHFSKISHTRICYGETCLARRGNVHKSFVHSFENCSAVQGSISRARGALETVPYPTDTTTLVKKALFKCVIPEAGQVCMHFQVYFRTSAISLANCSTQEIKNESSKHKRKSQKVPFRIFRFSARRKLWF